MNYTSKIVPRRFMVKHSVDLNAYEYPPDYIIADTIDDISMYIATKIMEEPSIIKRTECKDNMAIEFSADFVILTMEEYKQVKNDAFSDGVNVGIRNKMIVN
jgi:hypothetical protein